MPLKLKIFLPGICLLFLFRHPLYASQPPSYEIGAAIDTAAHKISAEEKVIFTNNSDQPLREIYFHIYPHRKYTPEEVSFMYRYAGYFKIDLFPEGLPERRFEDRSNHFSESTSKLCN